jgi:hypothetical protein
LLELQCHKAYGETAEVFSSHAHECEFLNVVDALQWHLRPLPVRRVFGKKKSMLGENHPDTLLSMYNLEVLYYNKGQYFESRPRT